MRAIFKILIILLIAVLGYVVNSVFDSKDREIILVEKVVDGDTIKDIEGNKYRIIGVNTPEKGEIGYEKANEYLKRKIQEANITEIKRYGKDKYKRELIMLYIDGKDYGQQILEEGLAVPYYDDKIDFIKWEEYLKAQNEAFNENKGIWRKDERYHCINIEKKNYDFIIENKCSSEINEKLIIRDTSSAHHYLKKVKLGTNERIKISEKCYEKNVINLCERIFNNNGDELIIFSEKGIIALYKYGVYDSEIFSTVYK